jgi:hypothetical protein
MTAPTASLKEAGELRATAKALVKMADALDRTSDALKRAAEELTSFEDDDT